MLTPAERALCDRRVVPVVFEAGERWSERLLAAGFDPSRPAVFVLEGLTYYLTAAENEEVFSGIAALAAPGSSLVMDMVNGDFMTAMADSWHLGDLRARGCGWQWGSNDPSAVLARHGFDATVYDVDDLQIMRPVYGNPGGAGAGVHAPAPAREVRGSGGRHGGGA